MTLRTMFFRTLEESRPTRIEFCDSEFVGVRVSVPLLNGKGFHRPSKRVALKPLTPQSRILIAVCLKTIHVRRAELASWHWLTNRPFDPLTCRTGWPARSWTPPRPAPTLSRLELRCPDPGVGAGLLSAWAQPLRMGLWVPALGMLSRFGRICDT